MAIGLGQSAETEKIGRCPPGHLPACWGFPKLKETDMARNETSGSRVGHIASQALRNPKSVTPKQIKSLAGSVLTQRPDKRK
jgi:hypothetical protein